MNFALVQNSGRGMVVKTLKTSTQ